MATFVNFSLLFTFLMSGGIAKFVYPIFNASSHSVGVVRLWLLSSLFRSFVIGARGPTDHFSVDRHKPCILMSHPHPLNRCISVSKLSRCVMLHWITLSNATVVDSKAAIQSLLSITSSSIYHVQSSINLILMPAPHLLLWWGWYGWGVNLGNISLGTTK